MKTIFSRAFGNVIVELDLNKVFALGVVFDGTGFGIILGCFVLSFELNA